MDNIVSFVSNNSAVVFAALFALSEVLALIPNIKSNSVFQLVFNLLKGKVADK